MMTNDPPIPRLILRPNFNSVSCRLNVETQIAEIYFLYIYIYKRSFPNISPDLSTRPCQLGEENHIEAEICTRNVNTRSEHLVDGFIYLKLPHPVFLLDMRVCFSVFSLNEKGKQVSLLVAIACLES